MLRRVSIAVSMMALALPGLGALARPAAAEHVTLGVADPGDQNASGGCNPKPCTEIQTVLSGGLIAAPGGGRITSWWGVSHSSTVAELRVVRRVPPALVLRFTAVGTSSQQTLGTTVTRFRTDLPVAGGNLIGLTLLSGDSLELLGPEPSSTIVPVPGSLPDGTTVTASASASLRAVLQFGAQFSYAPIVGGVRASSGSTAGGETVTITGNHLTESTEVRFGSKPAKSFTIDSNTQITAKVPAEGAGTVEVTVVGPGGTSATSSADRYTFVAPTAKVSPSVLDFGDQLVGKPGAARAVTVTNSGTVAVTIGAITLGGPSGSDFTKVADACAGRAVAPGKSCAVSLVFTPGAAGARNATLRVDDDAADGPHNVVITGNGTTATTTGPTTTGSVTPPAPPSGALSIGRLHGRLLVVTVGSAGSVRIADAGAKRRLLRPSTVRGGPGSVVIGLRLTAAGGKALKHRHRLTVRARITFTPHGGKPATKTRTFTLH